MTVLHNYLILNIDIVFTMEGNNDLLTKYNKIAAEYSKLRSQVPVLKKALADEQAKYNEVKEELRVKEQLLRIVEHEADGFGFRNQQLTCRVTILQQELDALQGSGKKHKPTGDSSTLATLDEEFNKKLKENAQLLVSLNECKERHEAQASSLMEEIASLKLELKQLAECKGTSSGNTHVNKTENHAEANNPFHVDLRDFNSPFDLDDQTSHKKNSSTTNSSNSPWGSLLNEGPPGTYEKNDFQEPKNQKSFLADTVQKALEQQLFETQQSLQETKADRDRLKNTVKNLEDKLKEISTTQQTFQSISSNGENNGSLIGTMNIVPSKETVLRENSIKQFYKNKIDRITAEMLTLKSKVQCLEQECISIKCRHEVEVRRNKAMSDSLEKERLETVKIQEELSTTAGNYEAQLSAMSDHVASLNDVIQQQKDQIEDLHYKIEVVRELVAILHDVDSRWHAPLMELEMKLKLVLKAAYMKKPSA